MSAKATSTFDGGVWGQELAKFRSSIRDTYDAPPIAVGDSKRENPDKHSFLELPGEIRNQIYEYFVKSPSPLDVRYHGINCWTTTLYLRLNGEVRIPINIFLSCRKLYHEAASAFYGNNTFTLKPDDAGETSHSYIEIASIFTTRLGSQAPWLSKLELDVSCLKGYDDHSCYEGNGSAFPSIKWKWDDIFEVTPLLRAIWSRNLKVLVSFNKVVDDSPQGIILRTKCDTTAMTAIFQSICQGQLQLQRYGQHLRAVALKRDGSGGVLSWGTTQPSPKSWLHQGRFQANPDYITDFIAEDNGSRLKLISQRSKPLTLLTLPDSIQDRIFSIVVHPIEGTSIDLDNDTKFDCGLIHVNRHFYRTWRDKFLFENKFVLTISTKQIQTTLDDFEHLRVFLRKTYMPKSTYSNGEPDTITARIVTRDKAHPQPGPSYVLRFEMDGDVSLADLRINALPFVMETSTTQASNTVTIQIWTTPGTDGPATMTASHTMTLHQLRLKIVLAIMRHVYSIPTYHRDELPDFWINGFGDVVPTPPLTATADIPCSPTGPWHPASTLIHNADWDEDNYSISELHPIDYVYRNNGWGFHSQCVYPDSIYWQLFPFCRRTKEVLPYLVRCLDEAGLPDDDDGTFGQLRDTVVMCECDRGYCPREERDRQFFKYGF